MSMSSKTFSREAALRIYSWNVNGIRACVRKGFPGWLAGSRADIVGIQEVRARAEQVPEEALGPRWCAHFSPARRPGYSGVGLYSRVKPDSVETAMDVEAFDAEGRLQMARFGRLLVVNVYVPNGTGPNRDLSRIPFKLDFSRRLFDMLEKEKRGGGRILVMGDFNTAHEEIDIARPKENAENSGFRPEERAEFGRWIEAGWVDTFRQFEKRGGFYTWWSNRPGVREKNVGWRIDYILVSPALAPFVRSATIHSDIMGSDHCPISISLDPKSLE
jgi:exodeoxyribonuclease III